jgi:hypothetical protein
LITEQLYQDTHQVYLLTTRGELLNFEGEHCCRVLPFDFPTGCPEQTANALFRYRLEES